MLYLNQEKGDIVNLGKENEMLEFKQSTSELVDAMNILRAL